MSEAGEATALRWTDQVPPEVDVAVVGGGFSGLMALVHLCRALPGGRFALLERRPLPLPGTAYGGCDARHLLNVPAGRMGAFPDDATAFHRWLEGRAPGRFAAHEFVPRAMFGEYLVETVGRELRATSARACLVHDAVVHLERLPSAMELLLASGRSMVAHAVILAPGLPPARAPWSRVDHRVPRRALVANPWEPGAFRVEPADAEVLVVGSGLTAIDVVQGLRRAGHRGVIRMVSRKGRLPLGHAQPGEAPVQVPLERFSGGPARVLRALRELVHERIREGKSWQGGLDAIRPHVTAVWQSWSPVQRRRFLRHARALWEIHRHRAPAAVLGDMADQMRAGTLLLDRGDIAAMHPGPGETVEVRVRGVDGSERVHRAARVFNCIGPGMSVRDTVDPLIGSMLRSGLAVADEVGLGLRTDAVGHVLGADLRPDERLFLLGAFRRGDLWESTAVPELRGQAATAAGAAAELVARELPGARVARPGAAAGDPRPEPAGCD